MASIRPDQGKGPRTAEFGVGQVVYHRLFGYRGVVVDVDPCFLGTEEWYRQVARTSPPKDAPWYHVLVDVEAGGGNATYVAERNLAADDTGDPVEHPLVETFFDGFAEGVYHRPLTLN
jgi:heat shock protein HspQ